MDFEKVKALRLKRGLTQEEAAQLAGLRGKQGWYEIESGRKSNLTIATLEAVARALGVKPGDLLKG